MSMTEREVTARWREYVNTRQPSLREEMIRHYAILARRAVERLQISPWGCVSNDDLLSHAILGLIDAVDRYDPEHGTPFEGFAMPRIRGAILDALRQLDWVPRTVRVKESRLRRAYGELEATLGRPPTDPEVARELGMELEELERLEAEVARGSVLSLDDLVPAGGRGGGPAHSAAGSRENARSGSEGARAGATGTGDGASTTLGDVTPDVAAPDPHHRHELGEARARLVEAIHALPEREKLVVSLYYYHGLTLKEIGLILSVTEQRVSQIHARAILRLSHKLIRHTDLLATLAA
jgi:RNA polymerase sigma factor for flagellar operon FliA